MRKPKQGGAAAPQETLTLEHVPAEGLRAVYADSTALNSASDGSGALIRFAFTRTETTILSETIPVQREGVRLRAVGQQKFETSQRKIIEAVILMRPDQALRLSKAIVLNLAKLPQEIRDKYEDLAELPPLPSAEDGK